MSEFSEKVIQIVRMVPEGKVVSYGQVAVYAGVPRGARQVGWILRQTDGKADCPWWRVVNKDGVISIKGNRFSDKELQRKLLEADGVEVGEDFKVDMVKYRFIASNEELKMMRLGEDYIVMIREKYRL